MSYLDERETEEEQASTAVSHQDLPVLDLSEFKPGAKPRDRAAVSKAVEAGHGRGFARPTSAATIKTPKQPKTKQPAPPRVFVALDTVPEAGVTGQIAVSGNALMIYEFARRASWERMTRGELLSAMLDLWTATHGETPADFRPKR